MGFATMIGGGRDDELPLKNYREEIPDWFYDNCVDVRKVIHTPEEEINEYEPEFQEYRRLMNSLPLGKVVCFCTQSGYKNTYGPYLEGHILLFDGGKKWEVVLDWDTWVRWQRILMVAPSQEPKTSGLMFSQSDGCWWIGYKKDGSVRPNWRTRIARMNDPWAIFDGADV